MRVNKVFRYELKPNEVQKQIMAQHAGSARYAYNWALEKINSKVFNTTNDKKLHALWRQYRPGWWDFSVSKCVPQEALVNLSNSFKNHRVNPGYFKDPVFKKKFIHDSFRLTGTVKVFANHVQLPILGKIRLKEVIDKYLRSLKSKNTKKLSTKDYKKTDRILSATVTRTADRWYVSILVDIDIPEITDIPTGVVGIDFGIKKFLTLSNGLKFDHPKALKKHLKLLKRRQKQKDKKQKGSHNRLKSSLKLARLHAKIANIRRDYLNKITTWLARSKSVIVLENLNLKGMGKWHALAQALADAGFGLFKSMLQYKCQWYGSKLILADRWYGSSKTCSNCGWYYKDLSLKERSWICKSCNTDHDRDLNAAINLKKIGVLSHSRGIYACGDSYAG